MRRVHSHYENLKVARNAPTEVIRAAYRVLAQRHHPDVNQSPDSDRIMRLLNEAWEVLGDPRKRAAHDAWIAEQEGKAGELDRTPSGQSPFSKRPTFTYQSEESPQRRPHGQTKHAQAFNGKKEEWQAREKQRSDQSQSTEPPFEKLFKRWGGTRAIALLAFCVIAAFLVANINTNSNSPSQIAAQVQPPLPRPPASASSQQVPKKATKSDEFPVRAWEDSGDAPRSSSSKSRASEAGAVGPRWSPNGQPWPDRPGYLPKMPIRATGGYSQLTIDNSNGGSDVYVKLCRASNATCDGSRHVFVPLGSQFTMRDISPNTYDIRYRSLDNGALSKSEPIQLREISTDEGRRYSIVTLTLYRVRDGNTRFEALSEENF